MLSIDEAEERRISRTGIGHLSDFFDMGFESGPEE
jgi:hypothetical protein